MREHYTWFGATYNCNATAIVENDCGQSILNWLQTNLLLIASCADVTVTRCDCYKTIAYATDLQLPSRKQLYRVRLALACPHVNALFLPPRIAAATLRAVWILTYWYDDQKDRSQEYWQVVSDVRRQDAHQWVHEQLDDRLGRQQHADRLVFVLQAPHFDFQQRTAKHESAVSDPTTSEIIQIRVVKIYSLGYRPKSNTPMFSNALFSYLFHFSVLYYAVARFAVASRKTKITHPFPFDSLTR